MDYLTHFAETECHLPQKTLEVLLARGPWKSAVVLPLCGEHLALPAVLESIAGTQNSIQHLMIAVINQRENATPAIQLSNKLSFNFLKKRYPRITSLSNEWTLYKNGHSTLMALDRTRRPLKPKEGVGLARKLGCDMALRLFKAGCFTSSFLFTTDADALLPSDYFSAPQTNLELFPFRHAASLSSLAYQATELYEISLRYYVLGLRYAGSPYAYQTLGSTLAFSFETYERVRGFPNRIAAEDFHFLNKAVKVSTPRMRRGHPILLSSRESNRVPFGTGVATTQILQSVHPTERYRLYPPLVFQYLKDFLEETENYLTSPFPDFSLCPKNPAFLVDWLHGIGCIEQIHAIKKHPSLPARLRHFHTWFDALKSLRFIHEVTRYHGKTNWRDTLRTSPFIREDFSTVTPALDFLRTLEENTHSLWEGTHERIFGTTPIKAQGHSPLPRVDPHRSHSIPAVPPEPPRAAPHP